eukprot:CAMPEP_0182485386 /NCGR_PEP_ID=MMETSP1319-20130603/45138_1 /TAXON_ID=172717 /ORGANISM="Bolidomonas pacifica, Strain RCC208" /LENGTH=120 /DNA_ID=CAMNT_0024687361 /DNA_START=82 /DNA_END=444 /DNA_ORIENTATION=+
MGNFSPPPPDLATPDFLPLPPPLPYIDLLFSASLSSLPPMLFPSSNSFTGGAPTPKVGESTEDSWSNILLVAAESLFCGELSFLTVDSIFAWRSCFLRYSSSLRNVFALCFTAETPPITP